MADVRLVIPFGREGAADRAARAFAGAQREAGISPESIPGGGGLAGVRHANALQRSGACVALLATPSTHVLLPARLGEDAAPDAAFEPMLGLGSAPNVLLVSPALGVSSLEALLARARSEALTYASAGEGQTIHVCSELLCALAGVRMAHRPYDGGSATAYPDLVAGRVHVYFDNLLGCRERIARGDAIALAVSARERSAALPQVPTLIELGFTEHALDVWLGIFGAGIAPGIAQGWQQLVGEPRFRDELAALGLSAGPASAEAFARQVLESIPRWRSALAAALRPR